jgi:uncharacterized iron-regulated membrane protein
VTATIETTETAPVPAPKPEGRRTLVPLVRRLHFYAGIFIAPFLLIAAVTGLLYTVVPQIDHIAYNDQMTVSKVGVGQVPVIERIRVASAAAPPGASFSYVVVPTDPKATTAVVFNDPTLTNDRQRTLYVDPYSGTVKGSLVTWFDASPAKTWLDDLHRNLHLGAFGRYYSEIAASWLWVLVTGGLYLWYDRNRKARKRARALLLPESARRGGRRTARHSRSWHAVTGVWIALILLFLSATGMTWSRYAGTHFSNALAALHAGTPDLDTALPAGSPPAAGVTEGSGKEATFTPDPTRIDTVIAGARADGITGKIIVTPPAKADKVWSVTEYTRTWPIHLDSVGVDDSGKVTSHELFKDRPLLSKVTRFGILGHMGELFGPANQVVLGLVALGLMWIILLGYRTWWHRRPTRADRVAPMGAPPDRGALRQMPRWQSATLVVVTIAAGWAVPLLGISLLAFLLVDVMIGAARRTRPARSRIPA